MNIHINEKLAQEVEDYAKKNNIPSVQAAAGQLIRHALFRLHEDEIMRLYRLNEGAASPTINVIIPSNIETAASNLDRRLANDHGIYGRSNVLRWCITSALIKNHPLQKPVEMGGKRFILTVSNELLRRLTITAHELRKRDDVRSNAGVGTAARWLLYTTLFVRPDDLLKLPKPT